MKLLRVAALAAMVTCASLMFMGASGCGSELHKASVAAASIGASAQTAATVNHDLIQASLETPDEGAKVAALVLKVAEANDVFVADLKTVQASGGTLTSAQVLTDFQAVVDSVNELQSAGIVGIKNPAAAAKFQAIMAGIQAQVAVVRDLLGMQTGRNRKPSGPGAPLGMLALGAIALTPEELEKLEEIIAELIAAGSTLAEKLITFKDEADTQLLNDAVASDAAAEQQAEADGGKS